MAITIIRTAPKKVATSPAFEVAEIEVRPRDRQPVLARTLDERADGKGSLRDPGGWNSSPRDHLTPSRIATLATALEILAASDLTSNAKRDISWAVRTFARGTGRTPSDIAATASSIRSHLTTMSPAMLGLRSTTSFYNLKSLLRRAVGLTGTVVRPRARAATVALNAQWLPLFDKLPGRRAKARLGGFVTYCSAEGYAPENIEDGHVHRYAGVLEREGIDPQWKSTITRMVKEWNQVAVEPGSWPKQTLKNWSPKVAFTPPLEAFSEAYQHSVKDYLGYLQDPPIEDDFAPLKGLRPGSVKTRLFLLRFMAAVLREHRWTEAELSSVNSLVTPRALDILLQYKAPQKDGIGKAQFVIRLVVLKSIAKYWAAASESVIAHISRLIGRHAVKTHSMAPANVRKLAELGGVEARANLLNLAPRVFAALYKVPRSDLTERDAALALAALYVELASMWPGRVGTLSKIHLTKNIIRSGHGHASRVYLHFVAGEIKNGVPVEIELPPHLVAFLDVFLDRYRPLLVDAPSDYLFPAKTGGPRSAGTMYRSVTAITRRYVGKPVNPNLFRHFMATLFLERRPGDYETVRRVLVHTSLDMAHQHYIGIDDRAAVGRFDDVILQARQDSHSVRSRQPDRTESLRSPRPSPTGRGL